jgi:hypothetical protein
MKRRTKFILGLGLLPFGGFFLYIGWALMETGWIDNPLSWFTILGGLALAVIGLTLTIMGIASVERKGV